ncbi:MAG: gliding motility-associated C-terminal domain-containing protein [Bacteroidales bacterium]|nr:gliding motility-associated C-terminal domain-containing protein [Bacteroidales bacterium]
MNKLLSGMILTAVLLASLLQPLRAQIVAPFSVTLHQTALTCKNSDEDNAKAALRADTVGALPPTAQMQWQQLKDEGWDRLPGLYNPSPLSAVGLMPDTWFRLLVTDSIPVDTTITVVDTLVDTTLMVKVVLAVDSLLTEAFPQPNIQITCSPGDTVYIQNPDVTFSFENLPPEDGGAMVGVDHFFWTFEHELTSTMERPVFTYVMVQPDPYEVTLTVYDDCGCETVFTKEVYVNPVKLKIPNVFTPNGDQVNDTWVITLDDGSGSGGSNSGSKAGGVDEKPLSTYYKECELVVMNRWGRIVYHSHDYQNDWDGGGLSDGTYYYILKCKGLKEEVQYEGIVMILTK